MTVDQGLQLHTRTVRKSIECMISEATPMELSSIAICLRQSSIFTVQQVGPIDSPSYHLPSVYQFWYHACPSYGRSVTGSRSDVSLIFSNEFVPVQKLPINSHSFSSASKFFNFRDP